MKPATPHHLFAGVARAMAATPKRKPKIVTRYDGPQCTGFLEGWRGADWSAMLEGYELGDPIGVGATEAEAIADLEMERVLHDS